MSGSRTTSGLALTPALSQGEREKATILRMQEMTADEVDALDRARTLVIVPISPVEEHGPHLPLGTDIYEAEAVAERMCARIAALRPGWSFLFYPSVPVGADAFRYPAGSVSVRPRVIRDVVADIGRSLAAQGFVRILVTSHHGSPRHNLALEAAARRVTRRFRRRAGTVMASLAGWLTIRFYLGDGLAAHFERMRDGDEARRALLVDCHAGAFETSEMLAIRPHLVRPVWERLEPVLVPLRKLRPWSSVTEARGLGYFGAPAMASTARGEAYLEHVVDATLPIVQRLLDGEDTKTRIPFRYRVAIRLAHAVMKIAGPFLAPRPVARGTAPAVASGAARGAG